MRWWGRPPGLRPTSPSAPGHASVEQTYRSAADVPVGPEPCVGGADLPVRGRRPRRPRAMRRWGRPPGLRPTSPSAPGHASVGQTSWSAADVPVGPEPCVGGADLLVCGRRPRRPRAMRRWGRPPGLRPTSPSAPSHASVGQTSWSAADVPVGPGPCVGGADLPVRGRRPRGPRAMRRWGRPPGLRPTSPSAPGHASVEQAYRSAADVPVGPGPCVGGADLPVRGRRPRRPRAMRRWGRPPGLRPTSPSAPGHASVGQTYRSAADVPVGPGPCVGGADLLVCGRRPRRPRAGPPGNAARAGPGGPAQTGRSAPPAPVVDFRRVSPRNCRIVKESKRCVDTSCERRASASLPTRNGESTRVSTPQAWGPAPRKSACSSEEDRRHEVWRMFPRMPTLLARGPAARKNVCAPEPGQRRGAAQ